LYAHGFASGPESFKGVALAKHYADKGVHLERLDLRLPSLAHLSLSAILAELHRAIGGEHDRAVLFGSSLGGLSAARVAESDARVCAMVLLAPGFRLAEQLAKKIGEEGMRRWREVGFLETHDYAKNAPAKVDYAFYEEAERLDARGSGWPDVRVPTLVVHGVNDDTCDVNVTRSWAKGKRNVRFIEVADGHELTASLPLIQREADAFLAPFLNV
jgi:hypothetical protein